ncbi:hypothetical protein A6A19_00915 [Actinobacillus delphinicola]|uniref:phage tail tape measure protein n=1 Tax=Actinobacillus delphinicola TaxID=51161 RepID=UPI0024417940|nr:phage tail tape measure protein [Actinobacillus delphinicola]MDG6896590.1 hypothetical protein [Actinobacillus delphinicola]
MSNNLQIKIDLLGKDQISQRLDKVQKATLKANEAFTQMKSKLKSLEQLQGKISSFKKMQESIKDQSAEIKKATQAVSKHEEKLEKLNKIKIQRLAQLKVARNAMRHVNAANKNEWNKAYDALVKAQIKYESTTQKIRKAKDATKDYQDRLKKLNATRANSIEQIQKVAQALKENGINIRKLSSHEETLAMKIKGGTSQLNREAQALERLNQKLILNNRYKARQAQLSERAQKAQQFGMKAAGTATALGYGSAHFLNPAIDFEKNMSAVQAKLNLDKNSPLFQAIRKKAMELGANTSFTAGQVAQMMDKLAMAGFTEKDILGGITNTLNLAKASGGNDPAQIADVASNIAGVFKIKAQDTKAYNHLLDILTHTAVTSNVDIPMLGDTMKYLTQATDLNLKPEQALAMAGMLGNVGLQGTQAGTVMRAMLNRPSGPNSATKKAFKLLHIKFTKTGDQAKDFVTFLTELDKKLKHMGNTKRDAYIKQIFGVEAVSGMVELIHQAGQGALQQYIKTYDHVDGLTAKIAKTMADNTAGDIDNMKSAWEGLSITIFKAVEPALRRIIEGITKLIRVMNNFFTTHQGIASIIGASTAALIALGSAIGGMALIYSFILNPVLKAGIAFGFFAKEATVATVAVKIFKAVTAPIGMILRAIGGSISWLIRVLFSFRTVLMVIRGLIIGIFAGNPIALTIAVVIAAIVGLFVFLYKKCKWFRDIVNNVWDNLVSGVKKTVDFLTNVWGKVKDFLGFGDDEKTVKLKQITENESIQKAGALQTRTAIASALNAPQVTIDRKAPIKAKGATQTINAPMTATININGSHLTHEQLQHAVHQAMQQAHNEHQVKLRASLIDNY